jgi:SAM-dependent methyltransferase
MSTRDHARERETEFFDDLVQAEGEFDPFTPAGWQTLARRLLDFTGDAPRRVLDLGCGTGRSRQIYDVVAAEYIGLDLSFVALNLARKQEGSVVLQGDACQLPFGEGRFDLVAFSSVLHHIPDFRPALREAFRVLRPGGSVFAFDPNLLHPAMALLRHPSSPLYRSEGVSPNERPLLPGALRRAFADSGFRGIRQRIQAGLPYRSVAVSGLSRWLELYNQLDRLMEKSGLGRFFGPFTITVAQRPLEALDHV